MLHQPARLPSSWLDSSTASVTSSSNTETIILPELWKLTEPTTVYSIDFYYLEARMVQLWFETVYSLLYTVAIFNNDFLYSHHTVHLTGTQLVRYNTETLDTLTAMDSILPPSDRHAARWICSDGAKEQQWVVKSRFNALLFFFSSVKRFSANVRPVSDSVHVSRWYNRRTASQPSHVVRQNLQKRQLRVLNPARIHVFYWFNWLNLIGS